MPMPGLGRTGLALCGRRAGPLVAFGALVALLPAPAGARDGLRAALLAALRLALLGAALGPRLAGVRRARAAPDLLGMQLLGGLGRCCGRLGGSLLGPGSSAGASSASRLLGRSLLSHGLLSRSLLGRSLLSRSLLGHGLLSRSLLSRSLLGHGLLSRSVLGRRSAGHGLLRGLLVLCLVVSHVSEFRSCVDAALARDCEYASELTLGGAHPRGVLQRAGGKLEAQPEDVLLAVLICSTSSASCRSRRSLALGISPGPLGSRTSSAPAACGRPGASPRARDPRGRRRARTSRGPA